MAYDYTAYTHSTPTSTATPTPSPPTTPRDQLDATIEHVRDEIIGHETSPTTPKQRTMTAADAANPEVHTVSNTALAAVGLAVQTPLHDACKSGDIQTVLSLLSESPDLLNKSNTDGRTPLFLAVQSGNKEVIRALLSAGADPNIADTQNFTPLFEAGKDIELIQLLLDAGAKTTDFPPGRSPIINAINSKNEQAVSLLLDKGVSAPPTLLHRAVEGDSPNIVCLLLARGFDVNAEDSRGNTALFFARSPEIFQALCKNGANTAHVNQDGETVLHRFSKNDSYKAIVKTLLTDPKLDINKPDKKGNTPLHNACKGSNIEVVTLLIKKGAELDPALKQLPHPQKIQNLTKILDAARIAGKHIPDMAKAMKLQVALEFLKAANVLEYMNSSEWDFHDIAEKTRDPQTKINALILELRISANAHDSQELFDLAIEYQHTHPELAKEAVEALSHHDGDYGPIKEKFIELSKGITNPALRLELAKSLATNQRNFSSYVQELKVADPNQRFEIACCAAVRNYIFVVSEISNYGLTREQEVQLALHALKHGNTDFALTYLRLNAPEKMLEGYQIIAQRNTTDLINYLDRSHDTRTDAEKIAIFWVSTHEANNAADFSSYFTVTEEDIRTHFQGLLTEQQLDSMIGRARGSVDLLWLAHTLNVCAQKGPELLAWVAEQKFIEKIFEQVSQPELRNGLSRALFNAPIKEFAKIKNPKDFSLLARLCVACLEQNTIDPTVASLIVYTLQSQASNRVPIFTQRECYQLLLRLLSAIREADIPTTAKNSMLGEAFKKMEGPDKEALKQERINRLKTLYALVCFHSGIQAMDRTEFETDRLSDYSADDLEGLVTAKQQQAFMTQLFCAVVGLEPTRQISDNFATTFGKFRNPVAVLIYAARVGTLNDAEVQDSIHTFADAVINNTLAVQRYGASCGTHVEELQKRLTTDQWQGWQNGATQPLSGTLEGCTVVDTDDACDLFLCGTEVADSCQHVERDPDYSKCLMGYVLDGKIRMIAIKDADGRIIARSMIRLLCTEPDKKCALVIEKTYPDRVTPEQTDAINSMAIARSKSLGVPLLSVDGNGDDFEGEVVSLGGRAYEYVDSAPDDEHMPKNGEYSLPGLKHVE